VVRVRLGRFFERPLIVRVVAAGERSLLVAAGVVGVVVTPSPSAVESWHDRRGVTGGLLEAGSDKVFLAAGDEASEVGGAPLAMIGDAGWRGDASGPADDRVGAIAQAGPALLAVALASLSGDANVLAPPSAACSP